MLIKIVFLSLSIIAIPSINATQLHFSDQQTTKLVSKWQNMYEDINRHLCDADYFFSTREIQTLIFCIEAFTYMKEKHETDTLVKCFSTRLLSTQDLLLEAYHHNKHYWLRLSEQLGLKFNDKYPSFDQGIFNSLDKIIESSKAFKQSSMVNNIGERLHDEQISFYENIFRHYSRLYNDHVTNLIALEREELLSLKESFTTIQRHLHANKNYISMQREELSRDLRLMISALESLVAKL